MRTTLCWLQRRNLDCIGGDRSCGRRSVLDLGPYGPRWTSAVAGVQAPENAVSRLVSWSVKATGAHAVPVGVAITRRSALPRATLLSVESSWPRRCTRLPTLFRSSSSSIAAATVVNSANSAREGRHGGNIARYSGNGGRRARGLPQVASVGGGLDKLERFLSKAGALSRTQARLHVQRGQVRVNDKEVLDPWHLVRPGRDRVVVDGLGEVALPDFTEKAPSVVLFNKPGGVVVSLGENDQLLKSQTPLASVLPRPWRDQLAPYVPALRPVGRLDVPSIGLLLLTDSSGLAAKLTDPGTCEKVYLVRVTPSPRKEALQRLRRGIEIDDGNDARGPTQPCEVSVQETSGSDAVLRFILKEGRNRQLRRMCAAVGLEVTWLVRTRVGPIRLGRLPLGEAREATSKEVEELLAIASSN